MGATSGQDGAAGTGEKKFVGPPDNQTTDPNTGGAGGSAGVVADKAAGGKGINVKIGSASSNVNVNPNSNGGFDFSFLGTANITALSFTCLLYTSPSPRDQRGSRMPSSA